MTFAEYIICCEETYRSMRLTCRRGQVYFNILADLSPALAEKAICENVDPFYDDGLIPAFLTFLDGNWS